MPRIPDVSAGQLLSEPRETALRPSETGVEATAQTARRIGTFGSQLASGEELLARETDRLGQETAALGAEKGSLLTAEGRVIGSGVDAIGQAANQQVAHHEIANLGASGAQVLSDLTDEWNATVKGADPTDPTVKQKFMDTVVNPRL